jgi:hypothetical protein
VTPQEVQAYSERKGVQERAADRLTVDISRAEWFVIKHTSNEFSDADYPILPEAVRAAVLLLAESFAADAVTLGGAGGAFQSESFDGYSYTLADANEKIKSLQLDTLLDEYVVKSERAANYFMRLRKL